MGDGIIENMISQAWGMHWEFKKYRHFKRSGDIKFDPAEFWNIEDMANVKAPKLISKLFRMLRSSSPAKDIFGGYDVLNIFNIHASEDKTEEGYQIIPLFARLLQTVTMPDDQMDFEFLILAVEFKHLFESLNKSVGELTVRRTKMTDEEAYARAWDSLPSVNDYPKDVCAVVVQPPMTITRETTPRAIEIKHFLFRKNYVGGICVGWQLA